MTWPVNVKEVKKLQMEISNYCNARCPACARETSYEKPDKQNYIGLNSKYVTLEQFKKWMDNGNFWWSLRLIDFCGNYDEPTTNPDLLDIIEWIFTSGKFSCKLQVNISTNGGTRNKEFWHKLGKISDKYRYATLANLGRVNVIWGIDGLEDTNHIYRRNVEWNKLQENFRTYIAAGGRASWQFIYFKHNEHQDELAKQRSIDEGFERIKFRGTKRTEQKVIQPGQGKHELAIKETTEKVVCKACFRPEYHGLDTGLYTTVQGTVLPCCWWGTESQMSLIEKTYGYQYDKDDNNLNSGKTFQEILDSPWFTNLHDRIQAEQFAKCVHHCKENVISTINNQIHYTGTQ
mgnify:CR=1 FL=1